MKGRVYGGSEMANLLQEFPKRIRRGVLNSVAARGATVVKKHAKKNIIQNGSYETGELYDSVKTKKQRGRHGAYIIYTAKGAWYAHLVERGTAERKVKKPVAFEIEPGKWITLEHAGRVPPKPFFRPALDENQPEVLSEMAKRMAKRMSKEAVKMSGKYKDLSKSYKKKLAK